jgi:hypothetical protein
MSDQGNRRPYRQEFQDIRQCRTDMWLVVDNRAMGMVGAMPIVAFGRVDQQTEYARSSRWVPLVLEQYCLVDAESVPGSIGVILVPGGGHPTAEILRAMVEDDGEEGDGNG